MSKRVKPVLRKGSKVLAVGEAPGSDESLRGVPFVGEAGKELARMAPIAGHNFADWSFTNVFHEKPFKNEASRFFTSAGDARKRYDPASLRQSDPDFEWPDTYSFPRAPSQKYLDPDYLPELARLWREVREVDPNIVVALGGTAAWAICAVPGIQKYRGAVMRGHLTPHKAICTYHPAAVLRNYPWRTIAIADLVKARRECEYPDIRRPNRALHIEPDLEFVEDWLGRLEGRVAVDIETQGKQISRIGFAPSAHEALVVPFISREHEGYSYWPDPESERRAWRAVEAVLRDPQIRKVGQNFIYDMICLWSFMGIPTHGLDRDTMLMHHAMQPEMPKSLDTLGSIYTNAPPWKQYGKADTTKRFE